MTLLETLWLQAYALEWQRMRAEWIAADLDPNTVARNAEASASATASADAACASLPEATVAALQTAIAALKPA